MKNETKEKFAELFGYMTGFVVLALTFGTAISVHYYFNLDLFYLPLLIICFFILYVSVGVIILKKIVVMR